METIHLVSISSDLKTETTGVLSVDRKLTGSLILTLDATCVNDINKKHYFLKIFYTDRPQIKRKLQLIKHNNRFKFRFENEETLILTDKDLHLAKIQEVMIGYKEETWVPIIKSFHSLPKRIFVTNLVSFNNSNTHFQLTGSKETQWYYPSLSLTCLLGLSLNLTVVLDGVHYHFNLKKKDNIYSIESPNFIPYTKSDALIVYASISDNDTHNLLWFSQNTRFPLSKGLSYFQIELRGYFKKGIYNPVLLIPRNMKNDIEVFNTDQVVSKIVVVVYKNSIYSLNYVATITETDKSVKFIGDAGPRKIDLTFKDGDTFTIINASIILDKAVYFFVNKSLQTDLFTLKQSEKRFKKEAPKSDII